MTSPITPPLKGVRVVDAFPEGSHPEIIYPMVQLKGTDAATAQLAAHLAAPATRAIWERFGFRVLR